MARRISDRPTRTPARQRRAHSTKRKVDAPGLRSLSHAFEQSPLGVAITTADGIIKYANNSFANMTGHSRDELAGSPIISLGELSAEDEQQLWETLDSGTPRTVEFQSRRKTGDAYWVHAATTPIANSAGSIAHIIWLNEDISERKRLEQALREDKERFRRLCEASIEATAIHDQGEILDTNPALAAMFGYEAAELIGMHCLDLAAPESRDLFWQKIVSKYDKPFEAKGLRKDGSTFPIEVCGKAISYQGRKVTVTALREATHRKRLEDVLQQAKGELETKFANLVWQVERAPEYDAPPLEHTSTAHSKGLLSLSNREHYVLRLLSQGLTNREIAKELGISQRTVDHHVTHILTKLNAPNRTAAVVLAQRAGFLRGA